MDADPGRREGDGDPKLMPSLPWAIFCRLTELSEKQRSVPCTS